MGLMGAPVIKLRKVLRVYYQSLMYLKILMLKFYQFAVKE